MLISTIRLLEPIQKQDPGIAQGCPGNPHRFIHTKCPLSLFYPSGLRQGGVPEPLPTKCNHIIHPQRVRNRCQNYPGSSKWRPPKLRCRYAAWAGAAAQSAGCGWHILSFFAAGKYPEAVRNAEGASNGGEIFGSRQRVCIEDAVGTKMGDEGFLQPCCCGLIIASKRVGIVIAKLRRLRATGSLAFCIDDAFDSAGNFIAHLLAIRSYVYL